jgi:hypothetical protein
MKLPLRSLLLVSVVLLSGCGGVKDWINETFDQGKVHKEDKKVIDNYLRSIKIYDQFTTIAIFDALWISDEVRKLYANTYVAMHGRSEEVRKTFLRRQLKANSHFITFYVLSTHEIPLNLKPATWVTHLKIGEKNYSPVEVKSVELVPEYELLFGKVMTNHKRPYEIRFDRKDAEGKDILDGADKIALYFSGPHHYSSVEWDIGGHNCPGPMEQKDNEDSNRD